MGEFARKRDSRPSIKPSSSLNASAGTAHRQLALPDVGEGPLIETLRAKLEDSNSQIIELTKENMKLAGALKIRDHELNRDARLIDTHRGFSDGEIDTSGTSKSGILRNNSAGPANSVKLQHIMAAEAQNRFLMLYSYTYPPSQSLDPQIFVGSVKSASRFS
jgi:hypothetical protein